LEYRREIDEGKTIIFSTTNGTRAIRESAAFGDVFISSYVNFSTTLKFLISDNKDVLIVCAGWKGQFSLEDALFSGKLAKALINDGGFIAGDDAVNASINLWQEAEGRLLEFAAHASHYRRLLEIESEEGLRYCFEPEEAEVLPKLVEGKLVDWRIG
jgi:2-phosphosulfolactate phosphatase